MIQAAIIIGTGLATTGLIGARRGIGVVFGALILGVARNPSLRGQLFSYAILGFAFAEATGLCALMMAFLLLYVAYISEKFLTLTKKRIRIGLIISPPKPHAFVGLPLQSGLGLTSGRVMFRNIPVLYTVNYPNVRWLTNSAIFFSLQSTTLNRVINKELPVMIGASGNRVFCLNNHIIYEAAGGAAVATFGYKNPDIITPLVNQIESGAGYTCGDYLINEATIQLNDKLIESTGGLMVKSHLTGSGSESIEAAMKFAMKYHNNIADSKGQERRRFKWISRRISYHGNTLACLSISGLESRKIDYLSQIKLENYKFISPCNPYRLRHPGETDASFVKRQANELDLMFMEEGPDTIIAFVAETVAGSSLGCAPFVPGYLQAMRDVCHKHGALFILDEVMCGTGRSGTHIHAWQHEMICPDIQCMAKGLGGALIGVSATLINSKVLQGLSLNDRVNIGQSYSSVATGSIVGLQALKILSDPIFRLKITQKGNFLINLLKKSLLDHPHVGDIRGIGLMMSIEFVDNKILKTPFACELNIMSKLKDLLLEQNMQVYGGVGCADGINGDHLMLSPSYYTENADLEYIALVVSNTIKAFFEKSPKKIIPNRNFVKEIPKFNIEKELSMFNFELTQKFNLGGYRDW